MKSHKSIDKKLITICTTLPVVSTASVLAETTGTNNIQNSHSPNFVEGELNTGINSVSRDKGVDLKASLTNSYPADAPGFQVIARNGEFTVELQASLEPQNVKVRAAIDNWQQQNNFDTVPQAYTNIEFITNLRPSLATGSINLRIGGGGTNYHGRFRDFLNPRKIGRTDVDLDATVFAIGKIGDWLFTGAYNSDRNLNEDCLADTRLFGGGQVCERVYPVYGDAGNVTATTPSIDSVYAKLERTPNIPGAESDYFLWGDYHTQEFARPSQLFSGMTRQLHGFKGNYNLGNLQVTALLANNIVRYQQAAGANQLLGDLPNTANLRFGLAYRDPRNDKLNTLLGYEYRLNPTTTPETLLTGNGNGSTEHVFAAEAIYAPHWQWEFYGKYAFRNHTSYLADNFTNTSTAHLAQLRATYQLGYRTDVAVEGRWLGQPSVGFNEFAIALESGYYLTPDLRIGVGYAFGDADDRDFTGYRSAGGPYLNITYKINELFAGFGRQKPAPKQQQESEIVVQKTGDRRQDTGGD